MGTESATPYETPTSGFLIAPDSNQVRVRAALPELLVKVQPIGVHYVTNARVC